MNLKIKRIIFSILVIINCIVIFNFSAQNAEKSSATSGVIVDKVVNTISSVNKKVKKSDLKSQITFIVRKCAHFSIYTLLGIWLMNISNTFEIPIWKKLLICVTFGLLYAVSDEFHQHFVGGRSPEVRDVCIDTCGVLFGSFLVIIFGKIMDNFKRAEKLHA